MVVTTISFPSNLQKCYEITRQRVNCTNKASEKHDPKTKTVTVPIFDTSKLIVGTTSYPLSGLIIIEATSSIQERMNRFSAWAGNVVFISTILWFAKRFFCEFAPLAVCIPFNLVSHVLPLSYFLMNRYNTK